MSFLQAISSGFHVYPRIFAGRAGRSEFWYWVLFWMIGSIGLIALDFQAFRHGIFDFPLLTPGFWVITFLPALALVARRLHDIGRTGLWALLWPPIVFYWFIELLDEPVDGPDAFQIFLGGIVLNVIFAIPSAILIFWSIKKGDVGDNWFGPSPLAATVPEAVRVQ